MRSTMRPRVIVRSVVFALSATCLGAALARPAQVAPAAHASAASQVFGGVENVLVPQLGVSRAANTGAPVTITGIEANVDVVGQVATTALDVRIANGGPRVEEVELLLPVPDGAVVRGFDFEGPASEPTAKLMPAGEARAVYQSIVAKTKDPALLEFAGFATVRSSVFPVPPMGTQRVRVVYEEVLVADGRRVDYVLPRSEGLSAGSIPWSISVQIRAAEPIATVYSPTHGIATETLGTQAVIARAVSEALREPGAFQICWLLAGEGLSASLTSYPDAELGGGYFLLLAGAPPEAADAPQTKREVVLVLDRSGSMEGEKFAQARAAALQVLEGLQEGESFNLLDYADSVGCFLPAPVKVSAAALEAAREYLGRLEARGGTALDAALVEALRQPHEPGTLPLVLFMTDGLPTVGTSAEAEIRAHAEKLNLHQRRIFTLGVGFDVNAPLLDRLADTTRAVGTFVHPSEDVAVKVAALAKRLHGPLLAAPSLTVLDESGAPAPQRVRELEPALMPDVFRGDQIVVLGRYTGEDPLTFEIGGLAGGIQRSWRMSFELDRASVANAFVPRLWASRRIDRLIEELRQAGAVPGQVADPRSAELSAEILALSTEFGILTEATSFLALEGTDLGQPAAVLAQLQASFREKVQQVRSGRAGVANSANHALASRQQVTNRLNRHYDQQLNQVEVAQVAQVADRAFFQRNGAWVDSRLVARDRSAPADRTIAFGSPEHRELAARLQSEGRQGILALDGNVLVELDGQAVLVRGPAAAVATGG